VLSGRYNGYGGQQSVNDFTECGVIELAERIPPDFCHRNSLFYRRTAAV